MNDIRSRCWCVIWVFLVCVRTRTRTNKKFEYLIVFSCRQNSFYLIFVGKPVSAGFRAFDSESSEFHIEIVWWRLLVDRQHWRKPFYSCVCIRWSSPYSIALGFIRFTQSVARTLFNSYPPKGIPKQYTLRTICFFYSLFMPRVCTSINMSHRIKHSNSCHLAFEL